jgi:selenocysteine lyase/cysteine desulfurase
VNPAIRALFEPAPGITFLDSATYGLPPEPTRRVLSEALDRWTAGTANWVEDWDKVAERARTAFATLIGVAPLRVALLPATSVGVGTIAADLTPADEVVVPIDEFTSVLFPLLVARDRGVRVREVPFDDVLEQITPGTTLVALTLVQMQTGRTAPIRAIVERAEAVGARVLLDATQGLPFVPLADLADRIDYILCSGYKHLLCPRGTAFMVVRDEHIGRLPPNNANWRAADKPYGRFFGGPLTLALGAAMYDISLAWFPWLGSVASIELLVGWGAAGEFEDVLRLARELATGLGVEWGGSSLVCMPLRDGEGERARLTLADAGIRASFRGTGIRLSTHVYNDDDDIARAVGVLAPLVAR